MAAALRMEFVDEVERDCRAVLEGLIKGALAKANKEIIGDILEATRATAQDIHTCMAVEAECPAIKLRRYDFASSLSCDEVLFYRAEVMCTRSSAKCIAHDTCGQSKNER